MANGPPRLLHGPRHSANEYLQHELLEYDHTVEQWKIQKITEAELCSKLPNDAQLQQLRERGSVVLRCESSNTRNSIPLSENILNEVINAFHIPREFYEVTLEGKPVFLWIDGGSCVLKTPHLGGRDVALAFSSHSGRVYGIVQGLDAKEFYEVFRDATPSDFTPMVQGLVTVLLNADASHIRAASETLQTYESELAKILKEIRDPKDADSKVYVALNRTKASLLNMKSRTRYIGHLLEHIVDRKFPMDFRQRMYFTSITDARMHEIECLQGEIDSYLSIFMFGAVLGSRQDSAAQSLTGLLTFILLPATYVAILFTLPIFNWENDSEPFLKSHRLWYYFVTSIILSIVMFVMAKIVPSPVSKCLQRMHSERVATGRPQSSKREMVGP